MVDTVFGRILVPLMGWHAQPSTPWDAPARMHVSRTSVSRAAPQPGAQAARRKAQAVGQPGPGGRCAPWFERIWLALGRKPRGVSPRSARAAARPSALRAVCMRWLRAGASLPFDADKKKKTHGGRRAVMRRTRPSCRPAAGLCRRLGDVGKNVGRPARDRARGTPTHKERNSRSAPGRRAPEGLRFCGPPVGLGEAALSTLLLPLLSGRRDRCVRHGPRRPPEPVRMRGWAHRVRSSSPWALPEEKKTCARPRSVCDGPCAWCVRLS